MPRPPEIGGSSVAIVILNKVSPCLSLGFCFFLFFFFGDFLRNPLI